MIPLSVPNLQGNELKYVTDAIQTEWVSTAGGYINIFEEKFANYLKVDKAVACQSGTAGLHLAMIEADIGIGTGVIVPTLTFIAAVNPVKYLGAEPIFMDCDNSLCMDMDKLEKFIVEECSQRNKELYYKNIIIKAVVVVHVFGNMANMKKLMQIAQKYNLIVIEDATEALGTYYKTTNQFAGTIGDYGVFSFNGNKIITTGGGGMIVAKNLKKLEHIKYLATQAKDDELNYIHEEVGYNYRMTNVQAAIGVAQLEKLDAFIEIKKKNYFQYQELLANVSGIKLLKFSDEINSNYWFYALQIDNTKWNVENLIQKMAQFGIQTRPIWGLISEQKPYKTCLKFDIDKAYEYQNSILNVPCSSNLTSTQVTEVVDTLKKVLFD